MRHLYLFLLLFAMLPGKVDAQLNIQLNSVDPYPVILPGIAGRSALTPLADRLGRDYLYVTANESGLKIYETSSGLNLIQTIDATTLTNVASTVYQRDTLLYIGLGDLFGDTAGAAQMAIVNVSDPANPQLVSVWTDSVPGVGIASGIGVIRVQGDFAYLGAMAEGLIILNISDPANISFVSKLAPPIDFPNSTNSQQKVNARGMAIVDSLVYLCYDAGRLRNFQIQLWIIPARLYTGTYHEPIIIL